MTLSELQDRLGKLLRVGLKRYPLGLRTEDINHAIHTLQEEFDSQLAEDIQTWQTVASQGEYAIDTVFTDPSPLFSYPIHVYYTNSEGSEISVDQKTYEELSREYSSDTDPGEPQDFAIFQREIMLRPVPDDAYTLYWAFQGYARDLSAAGDANLWTEKYPTLVLYRAAEYGTVNTLEDERVPFFQGLTERELLRVVANDGMRDTARRPESEEPG